MCVLVGSGVSMADLISLSGQRCLTIFVTFEQRVTVTAFTIFAMFLHMYNFVPENFHKSLFCDKKISLATDCSTIAASLSGRNGKDGKTTPENCHSSFMLSPHQPCKHLYRDVKDGKMTQKIVTFLLCYCCRHLLFVFLGTEYGKMRHLLFIVMVALWFKQLDCNSDSNR